MDIFAILTIILTIVAIAQLAIVFKQDMQMMQQNSYMNDRYFKWLKMSGDTSSIERLSTIVAVAIPLAFPYPWAVGLSIGIVAALFTIAVRKKYKKPVVFTKRVWRLYSSVWVATIAICAGVSFVNPMYVPYTLLAIAAISWGVTTCVNRILKPVEDSINRGFVNDAKKRIAGMKDMTVIGITGSYGKTSTKHYLERILNEKYNVLITPGSFNTPMGVTRTIREMMEPYHNLFICEMGAKNIGDIKEICDIVHPSMGIITAVGPQHLESFKSIENVQRTKFELVDALPADGFAVINNDFEYAANREVKNVKYSRYGIANTANCDYTATDIRYSATGTTFTINTPDGNAYTFQTKLVGECNISNLMAAIIIGLRLEVPINKIQYAVSHIAQVEHRLNIKRTPGGITIIDDAFNSNPDGSRMALNVLAGMEGGKRIVITPGMIELGDKQVYYNELFGETIAKSVDVAIVVGQYNREAILAGINRAEVEKAPEVIVVDSFTEAQQRLAGIAKAGDTVLYENDLPDTFK